LQLQREVKLIEDRLAAAPWGAGFTCEKIEHLRPDQLIPTLLRYKPEIVHFSGHGNERGELLFIDSTGNSHVVPDGALRDVFSTLRATTKCVVLNACYSAQQAQDIGEAVPIVIGMSAEISSAAAMTFASTFYEALAFDRSIQDAFDLGVAQVQLLLGSECHTPEIHCRSDVDPKDFYVRASPRLLAEFVMRGSRPKKVDGEYVLRLHIENAPEQTSAVVYQYNDDTVRPRDQFSEVRTVADKFAEVCSFYGDIEIRVTIWTGAEGRGFATRLSAALEENYGKNSDPLILNVIQKIAGD
jgi:hypothetical protein